MTVSGACSARGSRRVLRKVLMVHVPVRMPEKVSPGVFMESEGHADSMPGIMHQEGDMKTTKMVFASALFGIIGSSNCYALTGDHLYQRCINLDASIEDHAPTCNQTLVDTVMCRWYVLGMSDALVDDEKICPSHGVVDQQIALVVKKYLSDHPESLNRDAVELVEDALKKVFPCK